MTTTTDPRTVTLIGARFIFTDALVEKRKSSDDAEPKHRLNIVLPKDSKNFEANHKKVLGALAAASEQEWGDPKKWMTILKKNPARVTYRDGSSFVNAQDVIYAGHENAMAFTAVGPGGGQRRPQIRGRNAKEQITDPAEIAKVVYSGTFGDAIVSFYGTEKGSSGVFCTVELVRSYQTGDACGGGGMVITDDHLAELAELSDDDDPDGLGAPTTSSPDDDDPFGI